MLKINITGKQMSDLMGKALEAVKKKLENEDIGATVKFQIDGEGSIMVDSNGIRIEDGEAECTLIADFDTVSELMAGELSPTGAFMSGRLKVEGSMSVAMQLSSIFS